MSMKYVDLLKEHGLTAEGVPVKTRTKISRLLNLNEAIASGEADLAGITSKRAKAAAEEKITESKNVGQQLDDEICEAIMRYVKNKDHYDTQATRLKAVAASKKNGGVTDPVIEPAVDTPADPPAAPATAIDPPADPPSTPAPKIVDAPAADDKPKKKGSGLGWLLGGLVTVGLIAFGINYKKNN